MCDYVGASRFLFYEKINRPLGAQVLVLTIKCFACKILFRSLMEYEYSYLRSIHFHTAYSCALCLSKLLLKRVHEKCMILYLRLYKSKRGVFTWARYSVPVRTIVVISSVMD